MPIEEQSVKITFKFYSDILDEYTVETMWADVSHTPWQYLNDHLIGYGVTCGPRYTFILHRP